MRYLLDTNVVSDHADRGAARGELAEVKQLPSPAVSRGTRSEPGELVCVTVYKRGAAEAVRRLAA